MKYKVHRIDVKGTNMQHDLQKFINGMNGEIVSIIPNVNLLFCGWEVLPGLIFCSLSRKFHKAVEIGSKKTTKKPRVSQLGVNQGEKLSVVQSITQIGFKSCVRSRNCIWRSAY